MTDKEAEKPDMSDEIQASNESSELETPAPEKRRGRFARFALFLLVFLPLLAAFAVGGLFFYGKHQFEAAGPHEEIVVTMLPHGMGVRAIASQLAKEGVISNETIFLAAARITGADTSMKAGEYEIPARASMSEIMRQLREGRSLLHRLTIPEGLTSEQIMLLVKLNPALSGELPETPPEGSLLPETYSFTRGMTREKLVRDMQKAAADLLNELWEKRADGLPFSTKEEALILASIVEKETGLASERPRVAAVFVNRMKRPMRLQSDPTIIYGLVGGKGTLGRPIRRSELNRHTPYNTYLIDGLPPTPICNPGRASIAAVLNPPKTDEYFFVADGTGGHAFSRTLAEHEARVREWRKIERQRRQAQ